MFDICTKKNYGTYLSIIFTKCTLNLVFRTESLLLLHGLASFPESLRLICCLFVATSLLLRHLFAPLPEPLRLIWCLFFAASLLLRHLFAPSPEPLRLRHRFAPLPESLLLEGPWLRTPSACPCPARNSLNQNSLSSGSSSNMRDAGALQPWGRRPMDRCEGLAAALLQSQQDFRLTALG